MAFIAVGVNELDHVCKLDIKNCNSYIDLTNIPLEITKLTISSKINTDRPSLNFMIVFPRLDLGVGNADVLFGNAYSLTLLSFAH